jgi:hypothetical protein
MLLALYSGQSTQLWNYPIGIIVVCGIALITNLSSSKANSKSFSIRHIISVLSNSLGDNHYGPRTDP